MAWSPAVAHPWRDVRSRSVGVQRAYERDHNGRRHVRRYQVELLSCDHRLQVPVKWPKAARRRCQQCPAVTVDIKGTRYVPTVEYGTVWRFSRWRREQAIHSDRWSEQRREPWVTATTYPVPEGSPPA
jgi:hypothetical protein